MTLPKLQRDFGVYVHVPYCRVRCGYCDFNTYTQSELKGTSQQEYPDEAIQEMRMAKSHLIENYGESFPVKTVFFGGGTPTLLKKEELARMLNEIRSVWGLDPEAEISIEANPDSVDEEYLKFLKNAGFTRVSFGMQSALPHVLKVLDRTHTPENVYLGVAAAKRVGLEVSVDLIYGAPGESLADWEHSLKTAIGLGTDHISAYALIIEEGTKLHRQIKKGEVEAPDDDLQADMYILADQLLSDAGFSWYEISNWSRSPETVSRHNRAYWSNTNWWGIGPGAHSHFEGTRWWNVKHPAAYASKIVASELPIHGSETLTKEQSDLEEILLNIRMQTGLEIVKIPEHNRLIVADLISEGLVDGATAISGKIVLTLKGRLLADAIVHRLTA